MSESFMQKRHEKTGPQRTIVLQGPIFILPSLHRFQPYTHPASPYQLPLRRPHTYNTIYGFSLGTQPRPFAIHNAAAAVTKYLLFS